MTKATYNLKIAAFADHSAHKIYNQFDNIQFESGKEIRYSKITLQYSVLSMSQVLMSCVAVCAYILFVFPINELAHQRVKNHGKIFSWS